MATGRRSSGVLDDLDAAQTHDWYLNLTPAASTITPAAVWSATAVGQLYPSTLASQQQDTPVREWPFPLGVSAVAILGERDENLEIIGTQTNTYLKYRETPPMIAMWGSPENTVQALNSLEVLAQRALEEQRQTAPRTTGWAKPEKPASEKKKRKMEKKMTKPDYRGTAPKQTQFNGVFILPEGRDVFPEWLIKADDPQFNKLREEVRCWIYHEPGDDGGFMRIVGERADAVDVALSRLKNIFIERTYVWHCISINQMDIPTAGPDTVVKFVSAPKEIAKQLGLRPSTTTGVLAIHDEKEEDGDAFERERNLSTVSRERLTESNIQALSDGLSKALETVRMWQGHGQTRLRANLGRVIFTAYPILSKYPTWPAHRMATMVLKHKSTVTRFSPVVSETRSRLAKFIEHLHKKCAEYAENPRDSYELRCCEREHVELCKESKKEGLPPPKPLSKITARFRTTDGKLQSWDAEELGKTPLLVTCASLERKFDWRLAMSTSVPFPREPDSAFGDICQDLRLIRDRSASSMSGDSDDITGEKLLFRHTREIAIIEIVRRRTWSFSRGDWVIDIHRELTWDVPAPPPTRIDTIGARNGFIAPRIEPECVLKGRPDMSAMVLQIHHRTWDVELASNLTLGPGEPARWDVNQLAGLDACRALVAELARVEEELGEFIEPLESG